MATRIVSDSVWMATMAGALGLEPSECRRIIIDAQAGYPVYIYVEKFGTKEQLLNLTPPDVSKAQVVILGQKGNDEP